MMRLFLSKVRQDGDRLSAFVADALRSAGEAHLVRMVATVALVAQYSGPGDDLQVVPQAGERTPSRPTLEGGQGPRETDRGGEQPA